VAKAAKGCGIRKRRNLKCDASAGNSTKIFFQTAIRVKTGLNAQRVLRERPCKKWLKRPARVSQRGACICPFTLRDDRIRKKASLSLPSAHKAPRQDSRGGDHHWPNARKGLSGGPGEKRAEHMQAPCRTGRNARFALCKLKPKAG